MKPNMDYEKLERDLKQLRLPENLPKLSFDPDREPAPKIALRNNLLAAAAGVASIAMVVAAVTGIVRWKTWPGGELSSVPSWVGPSYSSFPVSSSEESASTLFQSELPSSELPVQSDISPVETNSPSIEPTQTDIPPSSLPSSNPGGNEPSFQDKPNEAQTIILPGIASIYKFFWNGWVYYTIPDWPDENTNAGFYRMRPDGSQNQALSLPVSCSIPVAFEDEWIYFIDGTLAGDPDNLKSTSPIYRMRLDASGLMTYAGTEGAGNITIQDGWMYYLSDQSLYRIRTNGEESRMLICSSCDTYCLTSDRIFYTPERDSQGYTHQIVQCGLDGGNAALLLRDAVNSLSIRFTEGDNLYYQLYDVRQNPSSVYKTGLYRIRFDGTGQTQIISPSPDHVLNQSFRVDDGWIYYTDSYTSHNYETFTTLCRVRPDGTSNQTLMKDTANQSFQIYNDGLYCSHYKWGAVSLYRVSFDGAEQTILYHHEADDPYFYSGCFAENGISYAVISVFK